VVHEDCVCELSLSGVAVAGDLLGAATCVAMRAPREWCVDPVFTAVGDRIVALGSAPAPATGRQAHRTHHAAVHSATAARLGHCFSRVSLLLLPLQASNAPTSSQFGRGRERLERERERERERGRR
jgi:hypothetical protein